MPQAVLPIAAFAVAAVGTGYSIYAGERANKAQRRATRAQRRIADMQAARQKREAIRSARISYANAQQAAANQGVSSSSGSEGGLSSISSQLQSNLSFLDKGGFFSDLASSELGRAQAFSNQAQLGGAIAGLGMTVFNNADTISKVFNPPPATATVNASQAVANINAQLNKVGLPTG